MQFNGGFKIAQAGGGGGQTWDLSVLFYFSLTISTSEHSATATPFQLSVTVLSHKQCNFKLKEIKPSFKVVKLQWSLALL